MLSYEGPVSLYKSPGGASVNDLLKMIVQPWDLQAAGACATLQITGEQVGGSLHKLRPCVWLGPKQVKQFTILLVILLPFPKFHMKSPSLIDKMLQTIEYGIHEEL